MNVFYPIYAAVTAAGVYGLTTDVQTTMVAAGASTAVAFGLYEQAMTQKHYYVFVPPITTSLVVYYYFGNPYISLLAGLGSAAGVYIAVLGGYVVGRGIN